MTPGWMTLMFVITQSSTVIGSILVSYGINVWLFQNGYGIEVFSLIAVCSVLPGALVAPVAGVLIDRFADKKKIAIFFDMVQALSSLALGIMVYFGFVSVPLIAFIVGLQSICDSFQWPGSFALISQLSTRWSTAKIISWTETGRNISRVVGPSLAAVLVATSGLSSIFILDVVTFALATAVLLKVTFQVVAAEPKAEKNSVSQKALSLVSEAKEGFYWLLGKKSLCQLLIFFTLINVAIGIVSTISPLLFMSAVGAHQYGIMTSGFYIGLISGGVILSKWLPTKSVLIILLGLEFVFGIFEILMGLSTNLVFLTMVMGALGMLVSMSNILNHNIWQEQVPPHLIGRVFSFRRMLALGVGPSAAFLAIPLSELFQAQELKSLGFLNGFYQNSFGHLQLSIVFMGICICVLTVLVWLFGKRPVEYKIELKEQTEVA